jgi:hypothetical protein
MGSDELSGRSTRPLILNEFKTLYRVLKRGLPPWISFLLLGFLVWVEEKTINQRIVNEVDEAIEEYKTHHSPKEVVLPPPVYSETGKDFFDEMRLRGPWKAQEDPSDPP